MTTYAPVPAFADSRRHPRALVIILAGHAALIAAVMTAKMDLPNRLIPTITHVQLIETPKPPPENPPPPQPRTNPRASAIDHPAIVLPIPQPSQPFVEPAPSPLPDPGPVIDQGSYRPPAPAPKPVLIEPRFATPDGDVKPPYPQSKLRSGEEAVLRLRLAIDPRGRVTSVEPVGTADPVFLAAARRHLLAHWRYRPATEDGRAVASSTVITLRFQLD